MTFEQWLRDRMDRLPRSGKVDLANAAWQAAQAAERERIMKSLDSALMLRDGIPSEALLLARDAIAKYKESQ